MLMEVTFSVVEEIDRVIYSADSIAIIHRFCKLKEFFVLRNRCTGPETESQPTHKPKIISRIGFSQVIKAQLSPMPEVHLFVNMRNFAGVHLFRGIQASSY